VEKPRDPFDPFEAVGSFVIEGTAFCSVVLTNATHAPTQRPEPTRYSPAYAKEKPRRTGVAAGEIRDGSSLSNQPPKSDDGTLADMAASGRKSHFAKFYHQ